MPLWPSKAKIFLYNTCQDLPYKFLLLAVAIPPKPQFYIGASLISGESNDKRIIKKLNDNFRKSFLGGRVMITQKVQMLSTEAQRELFERVKQFNNFTKENDPYGEHDFGSIKFQNDIYFWKIDYYDINFLYHSPDPSNTSITNRVLTIMHADEY